MTPGPTPLSRRRTLGAVGALMAGSVINGLAAYAVVAVGTRSFGAATFAPVSVLWTFWALAVAAFTFPVQHWIIRTVEVDGHEGAVRRAVPGLVAANLGVSLLLGLVALVWRERLFGSTSLGWPLLVFAVSAGSAAAGYLRGVLAGRRRFAATAAAIGTENLLRLAATAVVVVTGASIGWFAACLAIGPLVALGWPTVFRLEAGSPRHQHRLGEFLGGLAGGALLGQIALNAGPAVLAGIGGAAGDVTGVFATLALFRAPYLLALGLATLLTGRLTALVVAGDETRLTRFRRRFLAATLAGTALSAAAGATAGPAAVDVVFGSGVAPGATAVAALSAGSALAFAALIALLVLVARGATAAIVGAWGWAMAAGLTMLVFSPAAPLPTVAAAFVVVNAVAVALMVVADMRWAGHSRTHDLPTVR